MEKPHALSTFDCAEMQIELALAKEKIEGLQAAARFWQDKAGEAHERNAKLEERIRVADAEEPVARVTHTLLGFNVSYLKTLRGVTTLYAHAQIPAEVELKKLAEMYLARRKHAYKTRIQAQMGIGNMRQTEEEFNAEYDAAL